MFNKNRVTIYPLYNSLKYIAIIKNIIRLNYEYIKYKIIGSNKLSRTKTLCKV